MSTNILVAGILFGVWITLLVVCLAWEFLVFRKQPTEPESDDKGRSSTEYEQNSVSDVNDRQMNYRVTGRFQSEGIVDDNSCLVDADMSVNSWKCREKTQDNVSELTSDFITSNGRNVFLLKDFANMNKPNRCIDENCIVKEELMVVNERVGDNGTANVDVVTVKFIPVNLLEVWI